MSENQYSDDSMLSDEEKAILRRMREQDAANDALPPEQRSRLAPGKQDFPIGIRPDGTVNRVEDGDDD